MSYFDTIKPKKPPPINLVLNIPAYKNHFVDKDRLRAQIDQIHLTDSYA